MSEKIDPAIIRTCVELSRKYCSQDYLWSKRSWMNSQLFRTAERGETRHVFRPSKLRDANCGMEQAAAILQFYHKFYADHGFAVDLKVGGLDDGNLTVDWSSEVKKV